MTNEVDWINAPGAALSLPERDWLRSAAMGIESRFKTPVMVNLGIWKGATMHCLRAGAPAAILIGIDVIGGDRLIRAEALNAEIVRADADSFWEHFLDQDIHFVLFDADHRLGSMRKQLNGWMPKLVKDGIAAFHDYPLPEPRWAVKRAVDEWMAAQEIPAWAEIDAPDKLKAFRRVS